METRASIATLNPFHAVPCPFVGIGSHGAPVARVTSGDRFHIYANAGNHLATVDSWSDVIAILVKLDGMTNSRAIADRHNDHTNNA